MKRSYRRNFARRRRFGGRRRMTARRKYFGRRGRSFKFTRVRSRRSKLRRAIGRGLRGGIRIVP